MILTNLAAEGGRKNLKGGTTWSIFSHFGGGGTLHTISFRGGAQCTCAPPHFLRTQSEVVPDKKQKRRIQKIRARDRF